VVLGLGAALTAAVLYGVASILQAIGARKVPSSEGFDPKIIGQLLRQPAYLGALAMTLFGFLFHLYAVRTLPLFLAQTGIAVSLVVTALLAVRLFGEQLSAMEWAAVAGVVIGLVLLSASAGTTGTERGSHALMVSLFVTLALMVVFGFAASRSQGTIVAALLGLLGGFGYATVAISSRLLPSFGLGSLFGSAATYSLGLGGGLAFLLYSLALQRGSAIAATTPMISTQTVTPAVVGVALLGDTVRPGWWPGMFIGFVITAASAIVLVRFEGVREVKEEDHLVFHHDEYSHHTPSPSPQTPVTGEESADLVTKRDGE
jgi:drug/metabolite transporter (DMT)-like permease